MNRLPTMMGLPREEYLNAITTFYTCVIQPYRIFVWEGGNTFWIIERVVEEPLRSPERQYMDKLMDDRWHVKIDDGPLALLSVIHNVTSEGYDETTHRRPTDLASLRVTIHYVRLKALLVSLQPTSPQIWLPRSQVTEFPPLRIGTRHYPVESSIVLPEWLAVKRGLLEKKVKPA